MPKLGKVQLPDVNVKGFEGWVVYYILFVILVAVLAWLWTTYRHKPKGSVV